MRHITTAVLALCASALLFVVLAPTGATRTAPVRAADDRVEAFPAAVLGGSGGSAIAIADGYAYAGMGARLAIFDVRSSITATYLAEVRLDRTPRAVAVSGGMAYVDSGSDLVVVDVADPRAPKAVGRVDLLGVVEDIAAANGVVFIATEGRGLLLVDATNPRAPRLVSSDANAAYTPIVSTANGLVVIGHSDSIEILDVRNPTRWARHGPFPVPAQGGRSVVTGVGMEGGLVVVALGNGGLWVLDVANPSAPAATAIIPIRDGAYALSVAGGIVYVVDGSDSIGLIDIRDPVHTRTLGRVALENGQAVAATDGKALVSDGEAGLYVIDATDPGRPILQGTARPELGEVLDVDMAGDVLYVLTRGAVNAYDARDPAAPRLLGMARIPASAVHIAVGEGRVYASAGLDGVSIVDARDPTALSEVGYFVPALPQVDGVGVLAVLPVGQVLYVATRAGLQAFDVAQPDMPMLLGTFDNNGAGLHSDVTLAHAGGHLFVGTWYELFVLDVSDPGHIAELNRRQEIIVGGLDVRGGLVYIYHASGGQLTIVDYVDPAAPVNIGTAYGLSIDRTNPAGDVHVVGDIAYVVHGRGGSLALIDVAAPATPHIIGRQELDLQAIAVTARPGAAFVANGAGGLVAFRVATLDHSVWLPFAGGG